MVRKALCAFVLFLGACASPYPPLTPAQEVYQLQLQLDAVLAEVELYAAQPPCTPERIVACHNPEILAVAAQGLGDADLALDQARTAVAAGDPAYRVSFYANLARQALAQAARELAKENAP